MKINFIIPFTVLTGGIRVIFLYCNYLVEQGHDVVCYVPIKAYRFNGNILNVVKNSLGNIKRGKDVSWFDCRFEVKLVPMIKEKYIRDADVTIATAWPTAKDVYLLPEKCGEKVYFIQDYEIWSGKKREVDESYLLPLHRIVVTKNLQILLNKKFSVDSTLIYNGLSEEEFIEKEKKVNSKKTIIMLYNEASNKGTKEGIEILKQLNKEYSLRIILFGFKKGKQIPQEFEFYENPTRSKLMSLYEQSDIYLFPSKYESWGLPVLEAMSYKCAVVGNNVGCLSEIATNGTDALIVDNLDYCQMKKNIELLIKDEELLITIQNNGYRLAKNFEWYKSFKKFESYLEDILSNKVRDCCEKGKEFSI